MSAALPEGAVARIGSRSFVHPGAVRALAIAPDGKSMATGAWDGRIRIWEVATRRLVRELEAHSLPVLSIAYSRDGAMLVSCGRDKQLQLTDVARGVPLWTQTHEGYCTGAAFSPDGKIVASVGFDRQLRVWDVESARELLMIGNTSELTCVAWMPDGEFIATGDLDGAVRLWSAGTGSEQLPEMHVDNPTLRAPIDALAVAPGGGQIVAGGRDNIVRIWNADDRRCVRKLEGHMSAVSSVAFSPVADRVAAGAQDGTIRVWDALRGREILKLEGHAEGVSAVAFMPREDTLVSAGDDGSVRFWALDTGKELHPAQGHGGAVRGLAWELALASAGSDKTVRFYNPQSLQEVSCFKSDAAIDSIAWFGRTRVAAALQDGTMRVYMPAVGGGESFGEARPTPGHAIAMIPGSSLAVSASLLEIWDLDRGRRVRKLESQAPSDMFGAVAVSPDGDMIVMGRIIALVISGNPTRWAIWEKPFDRPAWTPDWADNVAALAFSPDGRTIASAGHEDRWIRLRRVGPVDGIWMIAHRLVGHESDIISLAFSPSGRILASGSSDRSVRLWDVDAGKEVRRLVGHEAPVGALAFSPDGARLASGSADGALIVWAL